ncbi:Uncharacterised protein [Vibrio cholerae]|nr:Uncharacterised protein [Vibrio cholerae]CSD04990.1 Uncharacterised protein [Vibrio cholerae]CSD35748.1 Uncharacterised protein [Vibrio cholerae]CSD46452.1 Uncharacterised protein [Vibrio cholerae]CSD76823.1 Uncharacterised protein [Vibrio cholerae]
MVFEQSLIEQLNLRTVGDKNIVINASITVANVFGREG